MFNWTIKYFIRQQKKDVSKKSVKYFKITLKLPAQRIVGFLLNVRLHRFLTRSSTPGGASLTRGYSY